MSTPQNPTRHIPTAQTGTASTGPAIGHPRSRVVLAACDLDRTLIYSLHAAAEGDASGGVPTDLRVVEHYQDAPLSHMTPAAWDTLTQIMDLGGLVPVTTRTSEQYARITLPQVPESALCANGGVLLHNGRRNTDWDTWVTGVIGASAPLAQVVDLLDDTARQAKATTGWVKTHRTAEGLFAYLVAHTRTQIPATWLTDFTAATALLGYSVSVQGRKVYAVPTGLTKAAALTHLAETITAYAGDPVTVLAAGDSLLDAPMLAIAHAAIRPSHGELHELGHSAPNLTITAASGARGGEEILTWMHQQMLAARG